MMPEPSIAVRPLVETPLSPLAAAIAASPQWLAYLKEHPSTTNTAAGSHPLLAALAAFMASPQGQALEAALISMLLKLLPAA